MAGDLGPSPHARGTLRDTSPGRRIAAALASLRCEGPHPGLLPALVEALGTKNRDWRWAAAGALVETGRQLPEVQELLCGLATQDERAEARRMACYALRELAPDSRASHSALLEASHDRDLAARRAAVTAFASLSAPDPLLWQRVAELLHPSEADPNLRRIATAVAARWGTTHPIPEALLGALGSCAQESDPGLVRGAKRALQLAHAASDAVSQNTNASRE